MAFVFNPITSNLDVVNDTAASIIEWQDSVLDKDITAQPGAPTAGDRYLLGLDTAASTVTGAEWAGHDGEIAEWSGTSWSFVTPTTGMFVAPDDEISSLYLFGATTWTEKKFEATTASLGLETIGLDVRVNFETTNPTLQTNGSDELGVKVGTGLVASGTGLDIDFATTGVKAVTASNLASTANALGASLIGIEDAASQFTSTNTEGALTESLDAAQAAQADITAHQDGTANKHDASEIDIEGTYTDISITDLETGLGEVDTALQARAKSANLASTANALGASLIGIEDTAGQFTSTNTEGALTESLDAAQAAQADISAHTDGTANKHDATEIDYERTDGSKKNIQAASDNLESATTDLDDAIGALDATPANYTPSNAAITADHLSGIDSILGSLSSTISNFEWQPSTLDFVTDNTALPATEVSGDRYILSDAGGAPNAAWDGASAGNIVEFNGTAWVALAPTVGTFTAADNEPNVLYLWGGASWASKAFESTTASTGLTKVGFDIRLDSSAAGNGLAFAAGVLSADLKANGGLSFDAGELKVDSFVNGDLSDTSFSIADNQAAPANVTGLAFANGTTRSAEIHYSIVIDATADLYEKGTIQLIQKGASWDLAQAPIGDNSLVIFSVTAAGQVQYTSELYAGFVSATMKFRAETLLV